MHGEFKRSAQRWPHRSGRRLSARDPPPHTYDSGFEGFFGTDRVEQFHSVFISIDHDHDHDQRFDSARHLGATG